MKTQLKVSDGKFLHRINVELTITDSRIEFTKMDFSRQMNAEIKAMAGWRWHGFEEENPRKVWSIANCPRNVFQLQRLMGEDVYEWWDQPLCELEYERDLQPQQVDMIKRGLTHHYVILAAEQGLGKSLASIEIAERAGGSWWFVGPKSALKSVERELKKWNSKADMELMTYQALVKRMRFRLPGDELPIGIFFDESTALKNYTTDQAKEGKKIADLIRETHGFDGYTILLSGTPTAKHPSDIWHQAEVAWPGFLREGSEKAFKMRYREYVESTDADGVKIFTEGPWIEEEVAKLPARYQGLMTVYRKKDWLDLPDKKFIVERIKPSKKVERVARGLARIAPNTITALQWCRALSSGFQYQVIQDGTQQCRVCDGDGRYDVPVEGECPACAGSGQVPKWTRETVQVDCPKDELLREWLDKCEDHGRIVIAAGMRGSVDRCLKVCRERGWAVVAVDGRGWRYYDLMGKQIKESKADPLDFWEQAEHKVAFVGNPGSCKYGLTLIEAHTMVFFDNDFRAENRLQMMDRIHRIGMDVVQGATIVDFIHLPVDDLIKKTLDENRKLETLSLGEVQDAFGEGEVDMPLAKLISETEEPSETAQEELQLVGEEV